MGTVGSPMEPVRVTAMASTTEGPESEDGPERPVMSWGFPPGISMPSGLPPGISMPGHQDRTVKRVIYNDILTYRCCHHGTG